MGISISTYFYCCGFLSDGRKVAHRAQEERERDGLLCARHGGGGLDAEAMRRAMSAEGQSIGRLGGQRFFADAIEGQAVRGYDVQNTGAN